MAPPALRSSDMDRYGCGFVTGVVTPGGVQAMVRQMRLAKPFGTALLIALAVGSDVASAQSSFGSFVQPRYSTRAYRQRRRPAPLPRLAKPPLPAPYAPPKKANVPAVPTPAPPPPAPTSQPVPLPVPRPGPADLPATPKPADAAKPKADPKEMFGPNRPTISPPLPEKAAPRPPEKDKATPASGAAPGPPPRSPEADASCIARLKDRGVAVEATDIGRQPDPRCTVVDAVHLSGMSVADNRRIDFPDRPTIACVTADTFTRFVGDLLSPLAKGTFGAPVAAVWTGPGLECRSRDHIQGAKLSAHGQGLAIDILIMT